MEMIERVLKYKCDKDEAYQKKKKHNEQIVQA